MSEPSPAESRGTKFLDAVAKTLGAIGAGLVVIIFVALVLIVGTTLDNSGARWGIIAGLMVTFLCAIGLSINKRPDGILIDPRNKISLSRLQVVLWTVLVLSAFLAIALPRSQFGAFDDIGDVDRIDGCIMHLRELASEQEPDSKDASDITVEI